MRHRNPALCWILELRNMYTQRTRCEVRGSVGILSLCNQQDLSVEPALEFAFPFLEGQSPQHRDVCQSPGDRGKFQLKDCYQSLGP